MEREQIYKEAVKLNATKEKITYDKFDRMQYHPDFHPNQGKRYSKEDLVYLCKFWNIDHRQSVAMALGRTEHTLASKVFRLRETGEFDYYRSLELEEAFSMNVDGVL